MLFLHIYGDNLEDEMGHSKFLCFYLLCALAAGLVQMVSDPESSVPVVGASGAVAGVMGDIFCDTKAKIYVPFIFVIFFKIFSMPAWIILGFWFALQLFSGFLVPSDAVGVAYWAHIGGFVAGLLLCWPLFLRRGGSNFWLATDGHPPYPDAEYRLSSSRIPKIRRGPR